MPRRLKTFEFTIEHGDIMSFVADVIALKYPQGLHGISRKVALALEEIGIPRQSLECPPGEYCYINTLGGTSPQYALYLGVSPSVFGYRSVRQFSKILDILIIEAPQAKQVTMTIDRIGLDETESILSQFAGIHDAFRIGSLPSSLEKISIVDIDYEKVQRLRGAVEKKLADAEYVSRVNGDRWGYMLTPKPGLEQASESLNSNDPLVISRAVKLIQETCIGTETKPHVFVAMPFRKDMEDVFHYGIQRPAKDLGFLCERIDNESFTGDIPERVKERIETAAIIIADLTDANPNVYLEVGYAWGRKRPTILLANEGEKLKFDVRGQSCLKYVIIKDLEKSLTKELKELTSKGIVDEDK